jgi:hypothetical protein
VLPIPVIFKRVQFIAGRRFQIVELCGCVDHSEFTSGDTKYVGGKAFRTFSIKDRLGRGIAKTPDSHDCLSQNLTYH